MTTINCRVSSTTPEVAFAARIENTFGWRKF